MKFNRPDPQALIDINRIQNLEYVKLYDLNDVNTARDQRTKRLPESNNNKILIPALMVTYDNGKNMCMDAHDEYFMDFLFKVLEVYREEQNSEVESEDTSPLLLDRKIIIDERTKKIFESGDLTNKKFITGFYDKVDSFDNREIYEVDEVKSVMDVTRFAIADFGQFANLNIVISNKYSGYRTNYVMEATINDTFVYLLVQYTKIDDNHYEISIANIGGINKPLTINIDYEDDSIMVTERYREYTLVNEFKINERNAYRLREIYKYNAITKEDEVQKYEKINLEKAEVTHPNLVNLDYEEKIPYTWYKLPWDAYIGYAGSEEEIDKDTRIFANHITYLDINDDNFYKRDYYSKTLKRNTTHSRLSMVATLDALRKITYGYARAPYYIIGTSFMNARGDGEYQRRYNGKHYYHIVKAKKLEEIKKENLVGVKRQLINEKADFLNDDKMRQMGGK